MAKYLLLKHYRGAPTHEEFVPMEEWSPEEFSHHVQYMREFADRLRESGEFVGEHALAPEGRWVRYDGEGRTPVTDGPFAETKDLIAGFMVIDVDSEQRAYELAAELSAAPGKDGQPIHEWLEVRPCRSTDPPRDPKRWLVTAAWRRFLDAARSASSRLTRELHIGAEPPPGEVSDHDDTMELYLRCAHPSLTASSAVALTLRAVGGLTTRQIAEAYLVPEATMAQRISRAKRTVSEVRLDEPGALQTVLRVLYLVFNAGYSGDVDLSQEAIRLARRLHAVTDHPETAGLLALTLLHHARRPARTAADGSLVTLAEQDRSLWDTTLVTEGVAILQAALVRDRLGEYQAQAAIAALHCDARSTAQTDWVQVVEWYDELVQLTGSPIHRLNRAVAVGQADGAQAGLAALERLDSTLPRYEAVAAHLHELAGDSDRAAELYVSAARRATSIPERDHLTRQAARLRSST